MRLPAGAPPGRPQTLGLRPQSLRLDPTGPLRGEVEMVERLGNETVVAFWWNRDRRWLAALAGDHVFRRGDAVRFSMTEADAHLFDENGRRVPLARRGDVGVT